MNVVIHFATTALVYPDLQDPPSFVELPEGGIACGRPLGTSGGLRTTNWPEVICGRCFDARTEGLAIRMRYLRLRNVTFPAFLNAGRNARRGLSGFIKQHPGVFVAILGIAVTVLIWRFPNS